MIKLALAFTLFCVVITKTTSDRNGYDGRYMQPGYTKMKRGKPYSSQPQRFYSKPPRYPKGASSYNPSPNYMDDESRYRGKSRKVSYNYEDNDGPLTNDGLGDEDLQNFVKYLSKQDLDKVIEFAGYNKNNERYKDPFEKYVDYRPTTDEYTSVYDSTHDLDKFNPSPTEDESKIFSALVKEIDSDAKFIYYHEKNNDYRLANYVTEPTPLEAFYSDIPQSINFPLDTQESMQSQIAHNIPNNYPLYTDSKIMPEEILPQPLNLRNDQDFEVSFTNHVPRVVQADSSYQLENVGDLPLMNYHSKLDTLSSYHVPHYTVTTSKSLSSSSAPSSSYSAPSSSYSAPSSSYSAPSSSYSAAPSRVPSVELAPPPSAAKMQSDAHLKAVRIWSHKSQGTAYTLHDDGTLSLEKPERPRGGYGYP